MNNFEQQLIKFTEKYTTPYQKLEFLFNIFTNCFKAKTNAKNTGDIFNSKKGQCGDFAKAFADVCNKIGISCDRVIGKYKLYDEYSTHAWNVVRLNGNNFYIDTFSASKYKEDGYNPQVFFMKNINEMRKLGFYERMFIEESALTY